MSCGNVHISNIIKLPEESRKLGILPGPIYDSSIEIDLRIFNFQQHFLPQPEQNEKKTSKIHTVQIVRS